jgi:hypothetical protein
MKMPHGRIPHLHFEIVILIQFLQSSLPSIQIIPTRQLTQERNIDAPIEHHSVRPSLNLFQSFQGTPNWWLWAVQEGRQCVLPNRKVVILGTGQ